MALDKAKLRFAFWVGTSVILAVLVVPDFPTLLSQTLDDTFGSIYPALPFASLLILLFLLRWKDLTEVLRQEGPLRTHIPTRAIGLAGVASLLVFRGVLDSRVELASAAIVLCFYALALTINPLSWRFVLPYALVYFLGVTVPPVLQAGFGEPLAAVSSMASSSLVSLTGIPVVWSGVDFHFVAKNGDAIAAVVTPGCSSIISMTTFLGLLALMHLDMRRTPTRTIITGALGLAVLFVLNAVRITLLIWAGYTGGSDFFWGLHNWVGYAIFLGFYLVVLISYSGGRPAAPVPRNLPVSPTPGL